MQLAVCLTGVNDKKSNIVEQVHKIFNGCNLYYHTFTNQTHLLNVRDAERLFTMHYPKWHYHPMDVSNVKHGKFKKYQEQKLLWDKLYYGLVPIMSHSDCLKKIPPRFDLIIRLDYNTILDPQINMNHWLRKAYEKGPVGFMIRENRGPQFGQGRVMEIDKSTPNPQDDWYGFLPSTMILHHRKHFDHSLVRKRVKDCTLAPAEWGWYQVLSEPYGDIHTSVHGFAKEIK